MPELNIDDVLLLIHGEIASAVTSADIYGNSPGIKLSHVRVRMGQKPSSPESGSDSDTESNISLNTERFPQAKEGWLIDVSYSPSEQENSRFKSVDGDILPSQISSFFAQSSVTIISGIGHHYQKALAQLNINTIQQLAEINPKNTILIDSELTHSQVRSFQSLAHLVMSIPEASIPQQLLNLSFGKLLDLMWKRKQSPEVSGISASILEPLSRWLQQLELCLDNKFFDQLTFKDITNSNI